MTCPSPRLAALAAVLVVLALGFTACADDDAEPTTAPTAQTPIVDPTSEPTTPDSTTEPTSPSPTETPTETPTESPTESPTETPTETPTPTPTGTPTPTAPSDPEPSGPAVDPDAPPTTYDAAQARFDALGQEPVELVRFRTPQGIYCLLDSDFAIGCELSRLQGIPDADYCGEGPSQSIGRVTFGLDGGGPTAECNSDTIREPDARRLGFGTAAVSSATGIQCLIEEIGVTCIDPATSRGFFLGKGSYTVFDAG